MSKVDNPFRYFHSSLDIIGMVVMLYVRYPRVPEHAYRAVSVRLTAPAGLSGGGGARGRERPAHPRSSGGPSQSRRARLFGGYADAYGDYRGLSGSPASTKTRTTSSGLRFARLRHDRQECASGTGIAPKPFVSNLHPGRHSYTVTREHLAHGALDTAISGDDNPGLTFGGRGSDPAHYRHGHAFV